VIVDFAERQFFSGGKFPIECTVIPYLILSAGFIFAVAVLTAPVEFVLVAESYKGGTAS
jgi:hypothetical protein